MFLPSLPRTQETVERDATSKSKLVGDTVLLKAEKTNKLSINFNPDPFKLVHKTGSEVTLKNKAGVELKRNTAFVKKYNEHNDVSNGNGDQVVKAGSVVRADEPGASKSPQTTDLSVPSEIQGTSEVSENSRVQTRQPKKEGAKAGMHVWRSTRTLRLPVRY